ncbi:MAG TPA: hypothetical protein VFV33_12515, partial [Gemmatimonadaceae bacterium]|nr:hypothetical protein [Gemmatimonadaceae bacterium]
MARLLAAQPLRGDLPAVANPCEGGWLGASPFRWQTAWTGGGVGRCGPVSVTADATLYYIDDLLARLRESGVEAHSRTPADLIAAAVAAWGEGAYERLEGDYAFVALHAESRILLAARDWGGLRSLYYAATPQSIAFA